MKTFMNGQWWNFCNHCREHAPIDYESNGKSYCKQCCLTAIKDNQWFTDRYLAYHKKDK